MGRWWSGLLVPCAAAAVAVGAGGWISHHLLHSLDQADEPVLRALHDHRDTAADPAVPSVGAPDRVVVFVLDGVGEHALLPLVDAGALGPIGRVVHVNTGLPSLSRPGYHVIFTGVSQDVSGLRTNFEGTARADSLADRVHAGGGSVALLQESVPWFGQFFATPADTVVNAPWAGGASAFEQAIASKATLITVHLTGADAVGHARGAADPAYVAMVRRQLDTIVAAVRAADASETASLTHWLVGADHGHTARGGHGGPEPEVTNVAWVQLAAGADRGLARTENPERLPATVVAPWIAQLLRVQAPLEALSAAPIDSAAPWSTAPANRLAARQAAVSAAVANAVASTHHEIIKSVVALTAAFVGLLVWSGRRGHAASVLPTIAAIVAFLAFGPGLTFSAIHHERAFLTEAPILLGLGAAITWPLASRWGASLLGAIGWAALVPVGVFAVVGGALGPARLGPIGTMLACASGLVSAGVAAGTLVAAMLLTARSAWRQRNSIAESADVRG